MSQPAILLTRPEEGARRFAARLRAAIGDAAEIIISPVLELVPTGARPDMAGDPVPVFSSRHGVAFCGLTGPGRCFTVGAATAEAARDAGFAPLSADADVEALLALILSDPPARPLIHLRGSPSAGDLVARLNAAGLSARDCVVYRQAPRPLTGAACALVQGDRPVIVPLFSPASAACLVDQLRQLPGPLAPLRLIAISQNAADAAAALASGRITVAARPDMPSMLACVQAQFAATVTLETPQQSL